MAEVRLPSFMIIGAVKAATTWLAHQLRHHPALWLPDAEPHFFSTEYHRGIDWYRSLFADAPADRLLGEKSADYLAHPDAAARIATTLPDVPLIIQLRNPVDRAYSDYCMLYRRGLVGGDPRRYLDRQRSANARFLDGGRYALHLDRLFTHLPRSHVMVILHDDVSRVPERVISDVCSHIGVDTYIADDLVSERRNDSRTPMLPLTVRRLLRPARPLLDPLRSHPLLSRARASIARPVRYPPLTAELRIMLQDFYRDDVRALGALLNRDLGAWLNAERAVPQGTT